MKKIKDFLIYLRSFVLKNKIVSSHIGDFDILTPALHPLPKHLKKSPTYSQNLPRITSLVHKKYPKLKLIDVGANIGDTVALVHSKVTCPIVCIEGDATYFKILQKNILQFKDVSAFQCLLGEKNAELSGSLSKSHGTAMMNTDTSQKIHMKTLDSFLQDNPEFFDAKMLKVDTDGYDVKILRGAKKYIQKEKPIIFFELDRHFLEAVGDSGIDAFTELRKYGYKNILFYDNVGRFLTMTTVENTEQLTELYHYTYKKNGSFPYYDVCVFHEEDSDLAKVCRDSEILIP